MNWERSNVGMDIIRSAFSNGLCKRTSVLFARPLHWRRCIGMKC